MAITGLLCLLVGWPLPCLPGDWAPAPPLSYLLASQELCLWAWTFGLGNRLFGGHTAPVGSIISGSGVQVLRHLHLPTASLPTSGPTAVWRPPFYKLLVVDR